MNNTYGFPLESGYGSMSIRDLLRQVLDDNHHLRGQVTELQARGTELLNELRAYKARFADVVAERARQDKLHPGTFPDGTGSRAAAAARILREACDSSTRSGKVTFAHVLAEECAEALEEFDPGCLRVELVQVAAVAVRWIEALDERRRCECPPEGHAPRCEKNKLKAIGA